MESRVGLDEVAGLALSAEGGPRPGGGARFRGVVAREHLREGKLVVFRGGWADLEYWGGGTSDEPLLAAPGWGDWMDLPGIERLLWRFADLFE